MKPLHGSLPSLFLSLASCAAPARLPVAPIADLAPPSPVAATTVTPPPDRPDGEASSTDAAPTVVAKVADPVPLRFELDDAFPLQATPEEIAWSPPRRERWAKGHAVLQGFLGVTQFEKVSVDNGGNRIDGDSGDVDEMPLIGGGGQWKLGGERVDFGLELMFSFAGRANAAAFAVGGGGAAIAVDVDLFIFDLYGGPFLSVPLGEKVRAYGAVGPVMQWASWDQNGNGLDDDGSGFGTGWYARTGVEFALPSHTWMGLGARWTETSVDLGSGLGDLDIDGFEVALTVTTGL